MMTLTGLMGTYIIVPTKMEEYSGIMGNRINLRGGKNKGKGLDNLEPPLLSQVSMCYTHVEMVAIVY